MRLRTAKRKRLGFCNCWPTILRNTRCPSESLISKKSIELADPGVYSQRQKLSSGKIPCWDNPDIAWFDGNVHVRIHNFSSSLPVGGALVHCDISRIGIGEPWNRVGTQQVNLGPLEERTLVFAVPDSDRFEGMDSVRVTIEYHRDSRISNNTGEQRIIYTSPALPMSPALAFLVFIPLVNNTNTTVHWLVKVLSSNAERTGVPGMFTLQPGQMAECRVAGQNPPSVEDGFWRATLLVEDTEGNMVGGITLKPYQENP